MIPLSASHSYVKYPALGMRLDFSDADCFPVDGGVIVSAVDDSGPIEEAAVSSNGTEVTSGVSFENVERAANSSASVGS